MSSMLELYMERKGLAPLNKTANCLHNMRIVKVSRTDWAIPPKSLLALLERIIKASSNQGDVVLDPFCGSGTTLRAAKTLGRKYIGIDQNPEAIRISENRLNPPQQELFTA